MLCAFDRPAFAGLDRSRRALGGDLGVVAEDVQQLAGLGRVVATVQVRARPVGQGSLIMSRIPARVGSSRGES